MLVQNDGSSKSLFEQIAKLFREIYEAPEAQQLSRILVERTLDMPFEKILTDTKYEPDELNLQDLDLMINRVLAHEPIQYVLEEAHFFGKTFYVNEHVLIPRQKTEELVQEIIIDNQREGLQILDIGSGSGCIGISIALSIKTAQVTCMDVDPNALKVTALNAERLGTSITTVQQDVLSDELFGSHYDLIVSNPPYIPSGEKSAIPQNVKQFEPSLALFVPDHDPLLFYKRIIECSRLCLNSGGKLYFEIHEHYGEEVAQLCREKGFEWINIVKDLNGKDRIIKAALP